MAPRSTRRAVLAAMVAAPTVVAMTASIGAPSAFGRASSGGWDSLFAEWQQAEAAYLRSDEDELGAKVYKLWHRLMLLPAPHHAALLWKMNYLWGGSRSASERQADSWSIEITDAVLADANRLLGGAA